MSTPPDDVRSLRRCVRELVALSTLSATWERAEPQEVAGSLADVLLRSLQVELVYVRVRGPAEGAALEVVRTHGDGGTAGLAAEIGEALAPLLGGAAGPPLTMANPVGDGEVRLAVVPIGYDGDCGFVVAGSRRPDFPSQTDRLLLGVGANQAAVVLQHKRAEAVLRETDRRKDEFLAVLAHELRNPLAPLGNGLEILRLAGSSPEAVEPTRAMMERQLQQMVRLVADLTDVSRINRGRIELRKERIELAEVVRRAVETTRPVIEVYGHELTVTLPPEPILLLADPTRLAQVFANLLNNAAKYTDPGGHIGLAAEREDGGVVVKVADDGIGLCADMLPRIFEMFTQVDRSLERSQSGLGIGLSLARGLVELHGGSIEARSAGPGMGSELTVRLPVLAEPVEEMRAGDAPRQVAAPGRRILVVDDNKDSAESLAIFLTMLGSEVRTAYDGLEAVEVAADFAPDVILSDIGMPRLNGYEAARRIREQSKGRRVVLVALTGWGQEEDRRRSNEAGFDFHLVKPVDFEALKQLLAALAERK